MFEAYNGEISNIPDVLNEFYHKANPIDVEITIDGNSIKFFPVNELKNLQIEYSLGEERYVFASCNGDPIYVYKKKIYTCCHGTSAVDNEYMADRFDTFMNRID